jgi:dinuclear metal center YbgI/SA1388 family protein
VNQSERAGAWVFIHAFFAPGEEPSGSIVTSLNGAGSMAVSLSHIIQILEKMAPPSLAEEWDNVGLQLGDPRREVTSVWVALDPSPDVVAGACRAGVGLLVTHHPLIFRPLNRINILTPQGAVIAQAVQSHLAIYSMHTNLDAVSAGLNDMLAHRLGLQRLKPLVIRPDAASGRAHGMGRLGWLPRRTTVQELALDVKRRLGIRTVRASGDALRKVRRVALATGSGGSLVPQFLASEAEAFITGDLRYHEAREIEAAGRGAIDIGHFHSEHLFAEVLAQRLRRVLRRCRPAVEVDACPLERDAFIFL